MVKLLVTCRTCDGCDALSPDSQLRIVMDPGSPAQRTATFDLCADCRRSRPMEHWYAQGALTYRGGSGIVATRVIGDECDIPDLWPGDERD